MKDIKSIKLPKYSGESYEPVAFQVYHNKESGKYCICLTADDMNEFIMEALLGQYSLNCAEYCGEERVIDASIIASKGIPGSCDYKAVLIQGFRAYLVLEHKGVTIAFAYGFDEKSFMGMVKGKQMISCIRGYER